MALPNGAKGHRPKPDPFLHVLTSSHTYSTTKKFENKKDSRSYLDPMRREGLEPSRPKAVQDP